MTAAPIATICLSGFPGADMALASLSRATGLTRHVSLASARPDGPELRFLVELWREHPPRVILAGGWSPAYAALIDGLEGSPTHFGVLWTSSGGQTDISGEVPKLAAVLAHPRIEHFLFSSPGLAEAFQSAGYPARHLPLVLNLPGPDLDHKVGGPDADETEAGGTEAAAGAFGRPSEHHLPVPVLSLFCPLAEARRKNVLNSLLALAGLETPYRLRLNGLAADPAYRALLEALKVPYDDRGWMPAADYARAIAAVGLGLQASFAESYNYVAAEHLALGVPVLVSRMVPVARLLPDDLRAALTVDDADDAAALRGRIAALLGDPVGLRVLGARAGAALREANLRQIAVAVAVLRAVIAEPRALDR